MEIFKNSKEKDKKVSKPRVLFDKSQELIKKIEHTLNAPFLAYYNGTGGSVCNNDAAAIYNIMNGKNLNHLYLFITSDGGSGIAALKIISILRNYCKKITVLIISECASAATMMALGADEIVMGPLAFLTAVDTSLRHSLSPVDKNNDLVSVSMDELNRVIKLWKDNIKESDFNPYKELYGYVHPLVFGAVDRSSSLSLKICSEILRYHMEDEEKILQISTKLNNDYPSHDYPILLREAKEIGLNVFAMDRFLAELLQELMFVYAQMCDRKYTDYDENSYHDSSILNIIEKSDTQIYYQTDKDWYYRQDERRWCSMNDESSWLKNTLKNDKIENTILHLR